MYRNKLLQAETEVCNANKYSAGTFRLLSLRGVWPDLFDSAARTALRVNSQIQIWCHQNQQYFEIGTTVENTFEQPIKMRNTVY